MCGEQLYYIAEGDLLEVARVKLAQEFLCHLVSHSDLHVTEEIAELLLIDDAVLVLVLILEQSQESIEEELVLLKLEVQNDFSKLREHQSDRFDRPRPLICVPISVDLAQSRLVNIFLLNSPALSDSLFLEV